MESSIGTEKLHQKGLVNNMVKNKYSDLKFLGFPDTLKALIDRKTVAPVHIRIKPTNICNHDCWYCAYHASGVQLGSDMTYRDVIPFKKLDEIATDIIDMRVAAVTFSGGGEPLLYKKLPEIIEKLCKGGVKVATLTNGMNLKGKMAEAFQKYGTWVRISLDGYDDDSYAKARGIKYGEFTKLLTNISNFKSVKSDCVLGCSFIVGKDNYKEIYNISKRLKESGIDHVKISGVVVGNTSNDNNEYHDKLKDEVLSQIEMAYELEDKNFSIINHYHDLGDRFDKEYDICPFILYRPVIGADLGVYTCQDKAYTESGKLGDLKDIGFKDFWKSENAREKIYSINPSKICNHHCINHSRNEIIYDFLQIDQNHLPFT